MLHLTNGEATASLLRLAEVPGEVRSVDDILMEGPLRNGLVSPADMTFRAAWLQDRFAIPKGEYLSHAGRRQRWAREGSATEVVLWSEEDLFCQVNLADLLLRLGSLARTSLVTPAQDDDRLGAMTLDRVHVLLDARRPVLPAKLDAARAFWTALCRSDPTGLVGFSHPGWPQLGRAAKLHVERFPWTTDGLGSIERALLRAIAPAARPFAEIFGAAQRELAAYGMADAQLLARLRWMAQGPQALVFSDDPRAADDASSKGAWGITELGRRVLDGQADAIDERGLDTWLGAAHLTRSDHWRYDPTTGALGPAPDHRKPLL